MLGEILGHKTSCHNSKARSKLFQLVDERDKGLGLFNVFLKMGHSKPLLLYFRFLYYTIGRKNVRYNFADDRV